MFRFHYKYLIRHKILEYLYNYSQEHEFKEKMWKEKPTIKIISDELKIDKKIIWDNIVFLFEKDKEIICNNKGEESNFFISVEGILSYKDGKYKTIRRKEIINDIFDTAKTISVIVLLITSVLTFIFTQIINNKNKQEIKLLQQQIELQNKKIDFVLSTNSLTIKNITKDTLRTTTIR